MSPYQTLYNIIQKLPEIDGTIQPDVQAAIKNHKSSNISPVMAFPLKVGGTFLREALVNLLSKNYKAVLTRGSYASTDQARDLYFPSSLNVHVTAQERPIAAVVHCHMYATLPVTSMLEVFNMPIVVSTRNILDTLLSYYEMLEKDSDEGIVARDDLVLQTYAPYHKLADEDKRWHLVNVAPIWFSRFYAYWIRYTEDCVTRSINSPLWTSFRELKDEGPALLGKIVRHVDPANQYSDEEVELAFNEALADKQKLRFNKGVSHRGENFFNAEEKATIYRLMGSNDAQHLKQLEKLEVL